MSEPHYRILIKKTSGLTRAAGDSDPGASRLAFGVEAAFMFGFYVLINWVLSNTRRENCKLFRVAKGRDVCSEVLLIYHPRPSRPGSAQESTQRLEEGFKQCVPKSKYLIS